MNRFLLTLKWHLRYMEIRMNGFIELRSDKIYYTSLQTYRLVHVRSMYSFVQFIFDEE